MRQNLFIIRGLPGSGKSTLATALCNGDEYGVKMEADDYFIENGVYKFNKNKISDAHAWCQMMTEKNISDGYNVYVANTFTTAWEVVPYRKIADRTNSNIFIMTCNGKFQNQHNVPDAAIERMRMRWEESV